MPEFDQNTNNQLQMISLREGIAANKKSLADLSQSVLSCMETIGILLANKNLTDKRFDAINSALLGLQVHDHYRIIELKQKKVDLPENKGLLESLKDLFKKK